MQTFLSQPESTFYHITTNSNWELIQRNGIVSEAGRIFVSRVGELPVLLAITFEQLPEIYHDNTDEIIFLKLPQAKNNFAHNEIRIDNQANEWTQPFQNIILRKNIPIDNIELMMRIRLGKGSWRSEIISFLTRIASDGQYLYQNHAIMERARNLI